MINLPLILLSTCEGLVVRVVIRGGKMFKSALSSACDVGDIASSDTSKQH